MQKCSQKIRFFLFLALSSSFTLIADDSGYGKYGLKKLSEEEYHHLENNVHKAINVEPNALGTDRINARLQEYQIPAQKILNSIVTEFNLLKTPTKEASKLIGTSASLPTSVNNSLLPSFPPIGNQGQLGSCGGWGSTYYQASHELGLLNGYNNKKSPTYILSPAWTYNMTNHGEDEGVYVTDAYDLLSVNGAVSILAFPYNKKYTPWDLKTEDWIAALSNRMNPYVLIPGLDGNLTAIKQALNNGHVLTFVTCIDSWVFTTIKFDFWNWYNPYFGEQACTYMAGEEGGHLMTIVGYDDNLWIDVNDNGTVDSNERGAFLVANSWGTDWGNSGFIWISYDAFLTSSAVSKGPTKNRVAAGSPFNSCVISITPKSAHYSPSLIAEFSMSQTQRNQITAQVGSSTTDQSTPASLIYILNGQGGALEFDGEGASTLGTVTFAADLTDLIPEDSAEMNRYYLSIGDSATGNPTILNSFVLIDSVHNRQENSHGLPKTYDNSEGTLYLDYDFQDGPSQDTTTPLVSITTPSKGALLKGTTSIVLTAVDDVAISSIDLYVDSKLLKTWQTSPCKFSLDTTTLSNGSHHIKVIAKDSSGNICQRVVSVKVYNHIKISTNAGGPPASFKGTNWTSDSNVCKGITSTITSPLDFTNPIYATARLGNMTYTYTVPNGRYSVSLKFAENLFNEPEQRVFDAFINGNKVISDLDLFSTAGFGNPYDLTFPVIVTDNTISIVFSSKIDRAQINAIQINSSRSNMVKPPIDLFKKNL